MTDLTALYTWTCSRCNDLTQVRSLQVCSVQFIFRGILINCEVKLILLLMVGGRITSNVRLSGSAIPLNES
jgi:hypothetical protein